MADINFKDIEQQIVGLAAKQFPGFVSQATQDGKAFLQSTQAQYLTYLRQLAMPAPDGIEADDFHDDVLTLQANSEMELLKQEGLAQVAIDQFTSGILNILITAGLNAVKLG